MGQVHAELELINGCDLAQVYTGGLDPDEVRKIKITALVDTGSMYVAINENIQEYLRLPVKGRKRSQLANGEIIDCNVVGPLDIRFENREITCRALVLPGDAEPLLGLIALEDMDALIDPVRQELIVNPKHPDYALHRL